MAMMSINATLIVQALNFFVAYLILRYFLCKPTVKVIEQEHEETEHLQEVATERTQALAIKIEEKAVAWKDFQATFAREAPRVMCRVVVHSGVEPVKPEALPSQEELEQLAHNVQHVITKKVSHVE
jgi:hypothetical protein